MRLSNRQKLRLPSIVLVLAALFVGAGQANADFVWGTPVNLGPNINSSSYEVDHSISADGLELFVESWRSGGHGNADIYVSRRASKDDPWGACMNIGAPVNTAYYDQAPSISADGLSLYFSSDRAGGYGIDDLWVTTRASVSDPWGPPVNLGATVNTSSYDWMPSISADGLVLFFMSGRAGGFGGDDLWFTSRATKNDPWGSPVNLGATINSSFNEAGPGISADSRMLFFSDHMLEPFRPGGYGGQDIWITTRATTNDPWGEPMNLGPVINGSDHDFSPNISPDGSTLYFCSNRPGGIGSYDLWQAPIIRVVDFNGDGKVNLKDFSELAQYWGLNEPSVDIGPMPWGDGRIDFSDIAVFAEYFHTGGRPEEASGPIPADGSTGVSITAFLSWTAGDWAESHEVYFGTTYPLPLVSTETDTTYAPPVMVKNTTYYWRIDEVNSNGKTTGQTWSFITETGGR